MPTFYQTNRAERPRTHTSRAETHSARGASLQPSLSFSSLSSLTSLAPSDTSDTLSPTAPERPSAYHHHYGQWSRVIRRDDDHSKRPITHQLGFFPDRSGAAHMPGVALADIYRDEGYGMLAPQAEGVHLQPGQTFRFILHWPGENGDYAYEFVLPQPTKRNPSRSLSMHAIALWVSRCYYAFFDGPGQDFAAHAHRRFPIYSPERPNGMHFSDLRLVRMYSFDGVHWHAEMVVAIPKEGPRMPRATSV
ncbi:hypothetical protein EVG20_g11605 [Dentipellis fragilis]|uniref:Uncharacterized protein n=1 Tax=Dentipellis fragilis TaxID=205917 RepID=A0A4Y9XJL8_9AGAM|nr:hypothetical protein EVG20_g11605 [Dentipellis fragilis]